MKSWIENAAILAVLVGVVTFSGSGCAGMFANETVVSYIVTTPDGVRTEAHYKSAKENIGLKANIQPGGAASFEVEKASTQEAVIAAVLSMQTQIWSMLRDQAAKGAGS